MNAASVKLLPLGVSLAAAFLIRRGGVRFHGLPFFTEMTLSDPSGGPEMMDSQGYPP